MKIPTLRPFSLNLGSRTTRSAVLCAVLWLGAAPMHAYDLSGLPEYKVEYKVTEFEPIRLYGSGLSGLGDALCAGFQKYQPKAKFENRYPTSDGWVSGLEAGIADIGISGREVMLIEYLSFNETFGYDPVTISIATGAADIKGRTWAEVIFVNKDNPIKGLTLKQLDGIFGSERTGGYDGLVWRPERGRSAKENIRTWDQLGLTGDWAGKEIQTYGYAFTGMTNYFQLTVFNGGDKWNSNYRQYIEYGTKMVAEGAAGKAVDSKSMLAVDLTKDTYGIAWSGVPHAAGVTGVRAVPLAFDDKGPFVLPTRENVQNRSYPLSRSVFMFIKHPPGQPVDPKVKEFIRYVLSREGQEVVEKHNVYLPLTPDGVRGELKKIE
ncbi:MAG: phosphate transporter periplasmic phosphate-binding protein [Verrucomicrobia bacterium]|nr:phosphate transporter periplasmic phosphate-binding protein [Verrucomicrobiota bacterium]